MTASLEPSRELYRLSGWRGDVRVYNFGVPGKHSISKFPHSTDSAKWCPAYDSDYLLQKLPIAISYEKKIDFNFDDVDDCYVFQMTPAYPKGWQCDYRDANDGSFTASVADSPADALCALAIQLWKDGILS